MKKTNLSHSELLKYQPNRYPFLMIDVVTEVLPGEFAIGYKNLTYNFLVRIVRSIGTGNHF